MHDRTPVAQGFCDYPSGPFVVNLRRRAMVDFFDDPPAGSGYPSSHQGGAVAVMKGVCHRSGRVENRDHQPLAPMPVLGYDLPVTLDFIIGGAATDNGNLAAEYILNAGNYPVFIAWGGGDSHQVRHFPRAPGAFNGFKNDFGGVFPGGITQFTAGCAVISLLVDQAQHGQPSTVLGDNPFLGHGALAGTRSLDPAAGKFPGQNLP